MSPSSRDRFILQHQPPSSLAPTHSSRTRRQPQYDRERGTASRAESRDQDVRIEIAFPLGKIRFLAFRYSQAVLRTWFNEPAGWLQERTTQHQAIRDELVAIFRSVNGVTVRVPEGGSYVFPQLPAQKIPLHSFVRSLRLQVNVVVTPGTEFSPDTDHSIRLNFSQNHEAAVQAVQRIAEMVERYRA